MIIKLGIPFWYNLKFFGRLERWNSIIHYEPYTYAFSKYMNPGVSKEKVYYSFFTQK